MSYVNFKKPIFVIKTSVYDDYFFFSSVFYGIYMKSTICIVQLTCLLSIFNPILFFNIYVM